MTFQWILVPVCSRPWTHRPHLFASPAAARSVCGSVRRPAAALTCSTLGELHAEMIAAGAGPELGTCPLCARSYKRALLARRRMRRNAP